MSNYCRKRLAAGKDEYLFSLKCKKCKNVWNSIEFIEPNDSFCPSCRLEQTLIAEFKNANLKIRYLETLYDTDKNILIFKTNKRKNISIYVFSNSCYTIYTDKAPITVESVSQIVDYLSC